MEKVVPIEQIDMQFVFDFHEEMRKQNLILVYEGDFNQEITNTVLSMTKKNLESDKEENNVKKKVFHIMVECLQNIAKHAGGSNPEAVGRNAIFMIGKVDGDYVITTGNAISVENIEPLRAKLEQINSLDKDGLKELYKQTRLNTSLSDKGGASLGFIDIARKSGNQLVFDFQIENDDIAFFSFQTRISRSNH